MLVETTRIIRDWLQRGMRDTVVVSLQGEHIKGADSIAVDFGVDSRVLYPGMRVRIGDDDVTKYRVDIVESDYDSDHAVRTVTGLVDVNIAPRLRRAHSVGDDITFYLDSHSVNALLPYIPLTAPDPYDDTQEDDRPRPLRDFVEPFSDRRLAKGQEEALDPPLMYIIPDQEFLIQPEVHTYQRTATEVPLGIVYLTGTLEAEKGMAGVGYTMRAVQRSLRKLMSDDHPEDLTADPPVLHPRKRSGVYIQGLNNMTHLLIADATGKGGISGAIVVTCQVTDTQP